MSREGYLFVGLVVGFCLGALVAGILAMFIWYDYDYKHSIDDSKPYYQKE